MQPGASWLVFLVFDSQACNMPGNEKRVNEQTSSPVPRHRNHEANDVQKEVEDIQVETQCQEEGIPSRASKCLSSLDVVGDERGKEEDAKPRDHQLHLLQSHRWNENLENPDDNQADETHEENAAHPGKIERRGLGKNRRSRRHENRRQRGIKEDGAAVCVPRKNIEDVRSDRKAGEERERREEDVIERRAVGPKTRRKNNREFREEEEKMKPGAEKYLRGGYSEEHADEGEQHGDAEKTVDFGFSIDRNTNRSADILRSMSAHMDHCKNTEGKINVNRYFLALALTLALFFCYNTKIL